ncbi:highly reducing polyketide synthase aurA-like [Folsomia candida]|uniref:highly reducing polyketide synthase aurA-like n=1 Tax=Folsomia candida TaxID=158441 RepID=UPI0016050014|nr:highly reducing polyketide synthase aurA-like [Folsomia candida]
MLGNYYFTERRHYESLPSVNKSVENFVAEVQGESLLLEVQTAISTVRRILPILRGDEALPDNLNDEILSPEIFYKKPAFLKVTYNNLREAFEKNVCGPLNILEVGAGTGSATECLISVLEEKDLDFSYTYTDVSSKFVEQAKAHFSNFECKMQYSVLNIENETKSQGFVPYTYDVILAANVLHRTKDLAQTTRNVAHLLKPGGLLLLVELFKPQRLLDISFVSGFWGFQDFDRRPNHCVIDSHAWETLLRTCGFQGLTCHSSLDDRSGLIVATQCFFLCAQNYFCACIVHKMHKNA